MGLLDSPPWGQPTSLGGDPTFGGVLQCADDEDVGQESRAPTPRPRSNTSAGDGENPAVQGAGRV
eukprot:SAG31_NODE_1082_length_10014_cov_5.324962_7_plen_64_part_01